MTVDTGVAVADFLTLTDPLTGQFELQTSDSALIGTHTVQLQVHSDGFDQTGISVGGNSGIVGKIPTLKYNFQVQVLESCPAPT